VISDNLFRSYNCLNYGCSKCCKKTRFWNIFSADQYEENKKIYDTETYSGKNVTVKVNGKDKEFYIEDHTNTFCDHIDHEGEFCRIHLTNPIHCALPLIKFKRVRNKTYVTKEYFGRNWNMKCPAVFVPMTEEGYEGLLYMMDRVKRFADEMEIETRIDDIIFEIKNKWKDMNYINFLPF
jgi:Fe-S-cluster containining protein